MYRKPWFVVVPVVVVVVGVLALILWRYLRSGAGLAEVSSWLGVVAFSVLAVLVLFNLVTASTHLRILSLASRGSVLSVAATEELSEELHRRIQSGESGAIPQVVSVTWNQAGAKFWEGGMDPIPLATIPWSEVASLALEHRSKVWLYPTPALVFTIRGSEHAPLRMPLVSASIVGFGPMSGRRAAKAFDRLNQVFNSRSLESPDGEHSSR